MSRQAVPAARGGQQRMHEASMRARHLEPAEPTHRDARAHRQIHVARTSGRDAVRRRRSNVLFVLVLAASSTLFLAATTKATVMLYAFALSFLALAGYVYLLAQLRRREEQAAWPDTWPYYA